MNLKLCVDEDKPQTIRKLSCCQHLCRKTQKEELRNTHKYSSKPSRCPFVTAAKTERLTHSGGKCLPGPFSMV